MMSASRRRARSDRKRAQYLVSKFGTSLAYDTSNSVELPNGGQRTELLTEFAGPFGGDTDFYKLELRSFLVFPRVPGKARHRGGRRNWRGGQLGPVGPSVHLFDRFFLGGISSLRGYRYHDVGPHEFRRTDRRQDHVVWNLRVQFAHCAHA